MSEERILLKFIVGQRIYPASVKAMEARGHANPTRFPVGEPNEARKRHFANAVEHLCL